MTDYQIILWEKEITRHRKTLRISYFEDVHDEAREAIARLEQAIEARREWLAAK